MVRVNLLSPKYLSDQHLIAEYREILLLMGYVNKHPVGEVPEEFTLGSGHIKFFRNKLLYLKKRHESIRQEMTKRGFKPRIKLTLKDSPKHLINDWQPTNKDLSKIKQRIKSKIEQKTSFYRYYGKVKKQGFFIDKLLN